MLIMASQQYLQASFWLVLDKRGKALTTVVPGQIWVSVLRPEDDHLSSLFSQSSRYT